MKSAIIIAIGDELLIGQVVDTNSAWMGRELNAIGVEVIHKMAIADREKDILDALAWAEERADFVLMTGGIGPTKDDITKQMLCRYFDTTLEMDEGVLAHVEEFFRQRGRQINELSRNQALVPVGATVVPNRVGTAPVLWFEREGTVFVSMPGVPFEMITVMQNELLGRIARRVEASAIAHRTLLVMGIPESSLAMRLEGFEESLPEAVKLAYLPASGLIRLRLTARGEDRSVLDEVLDGLSDTLVCELGDHVVAHEDLSLSSLLLARFVERGLTMGTAESCTGGYIAHQLISEPGASAYFKGGVVVYSNEMKQELLGVSAKTIERYGAVSEEVVVEMLRGGCRCLRTDACVAVSGIAGPDGGTVEKPVGLVWVGARLGNRETIRAFHFGNHRQNNIERSYQEAMLLLLRLLEESVEPIKKQENIVLE